MTLPLLFPGPWILLVVPIRMIQFYVYMYIIYTHKYTTRRVFHTYMPTHPRHLGQTKAYSPAPSPSH